MDYFQVILSLGTVLLGLFYYYKSAFDFWKNRGIPGPKPTVFVGNFLYIILRKISFTDQMLEWYNRYKNEAVFGIYHGQNPVLVINNLDMIKNVLIRDFSMFADRGIRIFPKIEPLSENLFMIEAKRWRPMRTRFSPIFTSGKLREMFPLLMECAITLDKNVDHIAMNGKSVDICELTAKYTTDVIGSCIFGINMNALNNENSEFRRIGKKIFAPTLKVSLRHMLRQVLPSLFPIFGRYLQDTEVDTFLINSVRETIKYRKGNNVFRPDFMNTLMEIQEHPETLENIEMTDTLLASQAFVFFVAGFDTSATTMSHALYELALNPDVQDKLREEITEIFAKNNDVLTFEQMKDFKYLDKVFKETLRKYPVVAALNRRALENYTFNGTKITVPKGELVYVPVIGIHRDPEIYPNPYKFDPERFNEDAIASRHPMSYLPFGDGPRNCIGARFAQLQSKLGLAIILRKHKVEVCENTVIPYKSDPNSFLLQLKGGVNLRIEKL